MVQVGQHFYFNSIPIQNQFDSNRIPIRSQEHGRPKAHSAHSIKTTDDLEVLAVGCHFGAFELDGLLGSRFEEIGFMSYSNRVDIVLEYN